MFGFTWFKSSFRASQAGHIPPVRKCTDCCGMNMSTNMSLKTRTRCYSFDQSLRECSASLSIGMMNKNCILSPDRVVSTVLLLLCETSCPPQQQEEGLPAAVPGLGTIDVKLHCCCSCWFAVRCCCCCGLGTRTHTRTVPLGVEGIHTTSRDTRAASRP